jgi:EAL domain-containing protein (putative c-di-GMP-specific phosphodiesterase class I)
MLRICADTGVQVIAEGIETAGERDFLCDAGIRLMQGYLFGKPSFKGTTAVSESSWPAPSALAVSAGVGRRG